ncbi:MAG: hypothetical protein QOC90_3245, partial [Mycobacterium sp.]|nr:hypothetical protein [Mycobacterium sp.]
TWFTIIADCLFARVEWCQTHCRNR